MDTRIASVHATEILDSRGHPTVRVGVGLSCGIHSTSSVPSGASTGANEAAELRDGDPRRYRGEGVRKAVASVKAVIAPALIGIPVTRQAEIDAALCHLDGTPNKARLGAHAILGGPDAARKLNQIGTVTETQQAVAMCRAAGWRFVVSHRSGETDDSFVADFAVVMGGSQIKAGSVCRGERIAKYNRLLEIEEELGGRARFGR